MSTTPISDPKVRNHLAMARLRALSNAPYLASALAAMVFLQVDNIGTVGIDQNLRTYVDPATVIKWSVDELAGVLQHEANHFLRSHHARAPMGSQLGHRWNVACDLEINDDLEAAGIILPSGALTPERLGLAPNHTAEWYMENLQLDEKHTSMVCCGSGATGIKMPWELTDGQLGVSSARARSILDQVAEAILESPPGTIPGGLPRWAAAQKGTVSWDRVLRAALRGSIARGSGQSDYSWSTPNRRHRGRVILPRLRGCRTTVLCVVDTSGSMRQSDIEKALGEVLSISKEMCVERTYVASCDTQATFHGDFRSTTSLELMGGGGTSLEKALEVISANKIDPTVVVFLTDGQTKWSSAPPNELVRRRAIVVTPRGNPTGPEWAESISI